MTRAELRSPYPVDHRAGLTVGRDGIVQVWQDGKRVGVVTEATALLLEKALRAVQPSAADHG